MFSFLSSFLYFLFCFVVAIEIPGLFFLRGLKLSLMQRGVIAFVFGMVLWAWQGMVFGYLGIRWVSYLYIALFLAFFLKQKSWKALSTFSFANIKKPDRETLGIIFIGVLLQTSLVFFMGLPMKTGIFFCCGATEDFLYHLGLTNAIMQHFPPFEPDMYGVVVRNYHYFGNIVVAELVRVFHLPFVFTQFQYMGLVLSLLLGLLAWIFADLVNLLREGKLWLLFFLYFGGDLIYLFLLLLGKGLNFSMGPLENGAAFLNNPPRAFAIIVFLAGLCLLTLWLKKPTLKSGILTAFLFGSAIGFKVYIGIFVLSGIIGMLLYGVVMILLRHSGNPDLSGASRISFRTLRRGDAGQTSMTAVLLLMTLFFAAVVYLPVNKGSGGLFFTGFWRFEEFIVQPALGLSHLELAREIFYNHKNYLRVILYDLFFGFLFIITIFGTKLIGIFQTRKSLKTLDPRLHIFLLSGMLVSFVAGIFFQQQSGGSNSFNFLVSIYIIGSIYTAIACAYWRKKLPKIAGYIFVIMIILLTIPRVVNVEYENIVRIVHQQGYTVKTEDLAAMTYLKNHSKVDAVVLNYQGQYVSFIANRPFFLGEWGLIESHGVSTSERRAMLKKLGTEKDQKKIKALLKANKIAYIYTVSTEFPEQLKHASFLKRIYHVKNIEIYKII